jgi:hypothetical protein
MKFDFKNLDERTRLFMSNEVKADIENGELYLSRDFNDNGQKLYSMFLQEAIATGDEQTLVESLMASNSFLEKEPRKQKREMVYARVPDNAAAVFAEGELNRCYIRGLCLIAIEFEQQLQVYRARYSENP